MRKILLITWKRRYSWDEAVGGGESKPATAVTCYYYSNGLHSKSLLLLVIRYPTYCLINYPNCIKFTNHDRRHSLNAHLSYQSIVTLPRQLDDVRDNVQPRLRTPMI